MTQKNLTELRNYGQIKSSIAPLFRSGAIITLNFPKSAAIEFSKGLKNEFETAVVNEPLATESLLCLRFNFLF